MVFENKYSSYNALNNIEETKPDMVVLRLNPQERKALEIDKATLQQEKDATTVKQLIEIARNVIHKTPEGLFFKILADNLRKNKRLGIVEIEPK